MICSWEKSYLSYLDKKKRTGCQHIDYRSNAMKYLYSMSQNISTEENLFDLKNYTLFDQMFNVTRPEQSLITQYFGKETLK